MEQITAWFKRRINNPQLIILVMFILIGALIVVGLGTMLAPVFAALVIAYLFEGAVARLQKLPMPRLIAVGLVYIVFVAALVFLVLWLIPLLSQQLTQLVQQLPDVIDQAKSALMELPKRYPEFITADQISQVNTSIVDQLKDLAQDLLTNTLTSVVGMVTILVYLILVPVLVFFFMKDKLTIQAWFKRFMPQNMDLATKVWDDVDGQIGNYIRGKALEILIIGGATFVTFQVLGLQYSAILATAVGFSVLIPYIGAAVVTLPVTLVALFQFGLSAEFAWVFFSYMVIQILDGNVLVPWLFSEVVDLHPVAIIVAILVFGGIWGFWGVFFAIPLATLVQAVLNAFHQDEHEKSQDDSPAPAESSTV